MRTVHFVNANMGLQLRDSLLKTVDPRFTRIIIWHTGILKAGAVLLTFVSLISFGSSSRVIKGDLFKDDEINLRSGPIQHYAQKSFCYRKGDLDNCIDFAVRSKALNLEQLLLADRRGHQQLLNMQSGTKRFCSPAILSRSFGQTKLDCVSSWELLLRSSMVSSSNSPVFGSTSHAVLHASILRSAMALPKGMLSHLAPIYQPSYDASDPQLHAPKASLPLVTTLCHRLLCPSTSYLRGAPSISNAILASSPRALDNSHLLLSITTSPPASQLSSHFSTYFPPYVPQPPPIQSPYVSSLSPSPFAVQSSESLVHSAGPDLSSIKPINARRSASVSTSLPDEFMPVGQIMRSPPSSLYPVMPKKFSAIWVLDPMPPVSQAPKQGSEHLGFRQAYTPLLTSSYFVPPAFLPEDFPMSFVSPTPADNKPLIGSPHRDPQQAPPRSVSSVSFVSPPPSSVITQRDTLVQSATSLHASGTSKLLMPPTQNTQHPGESRTGTSALPSPAPLLVVASSSIQCHDMCSPEPSSQAFQPSRSLHSERITPILATRRPLSVAIPPSVPSHDRWSIEPSFQSFDPSDKISFARVLPPLNARSSPRLLGDLSPALPPAPHSRTSVSPAGPAPVHINFAPPFRKRRERPPLTSTPATVPASRNATSPVSSGPSSAARERSRGHAAVAMSPESQGQPGLASSIISPSPSHHRDVQGSVAPSPRITPFRSRWRKPAKPVAASPMIFRSPPPNQDCATMSCTQPLTSTPLDSPCGCVLPMQVELELGVAPYAFFPLVPELAAEIAAGTYLKQSQVRIMGANADSQDQGKTFVNIDLVPLGEKFDYTTALLTYERFWQKKVIINETLFGDYRVIFVHYSGLPPSPPSSFSDGTHNGGPNRNIGGFGSEQPLGVDIRKRSEKLGGGTIAVVALSSAIAVVICLGAVWFILLKCSNQSRLPPAVPPMFSSSVTKKSGGGSILSTSMASSTSLSFASSMATYTGSAKTFTLAELERATDRFNSRNILGEGGFGRVYRGVLEDGTQLAVKVLTRDDQQGGREFTAEVEMLSRLHHRNLVKLVGICTEEHNRSLIYELIPNGSVESHLHGQDKKNAPLDWDARMKIALGAARGLAYLHEDSNPRVIHRDFKASNILLEDDFTPKVSDFGLAKAASDEGSEHISTRVMGTFGYVAPEYAMTGHLLVKSDVYSYGVVLLELLSGRKPVDMSQPPGQENLVTWARPLLTNKEGLETLVDPALGGRFSFDNMARVAAIASMCVQPEVSHRPFMGEVVQALKLVYNDSDASNGGGSGNYSQGGDSPGPDNDLKDESDQTWWRSTQYVPDSTSFVTIDYDSGPLQAQELGTERPLSASALLSSSGRFTGQPSGSFRRHSSSGPLRTNRSRPPWYRVRGLTGGSRSEHGFTRHFEMGLYRDVHELWP